jgi:predicted metal-binding protein
MDRSRQFLQMAKDCGIDHAAPVETSAIRFHEDFRKACERNACGKYDTNWMGPPAIGTIRELKERVLRFRAGLLVQTVHRWDGSRYLKGMLAAAREHEILFRNFLQKIRDACPGDELLALGAGCCSYCEKCSYPDGEPCLNPDQAISSVEAYGMDVARLTKSAGLPYSYGKGTICFVGLILFDSVH